MNALLIALLWLVLISALIVFAVEFGVWIMRGMLGGDDEHHAARAPIARIAGYSIGVVALVAFFVLATGIRGWTIPLILVGIPLAILAAFRKRPA